MRGCFDDRISKFGPDPPATGACPSPSSTELGRSPARGGMLALFGCWGQASSASIRLKVDSAVYFLADRFLSQIAEVTGEPRYLEFSWYAGYPAELQTRMRQCHRIGVAVEI